MHRGLIRFTALVAMTSLATSCARHRKDVARIPPHRAAAATPIPVPRAAPGVLPINRGLGAGEMLWHVRAALNVAALVCTAPAYAALAARYNAFLRRHDGALAQAYKAEEARYREHYGANWQRAFDRHQTALYNSFADPRATRLLCGQAMVVSGQMNALDPVQLTAFAGKALSSLEVPWSVQ